MGTIRAICISDIRGIQKTCRSEAVLRENYGIG